MTNQEIFDVFTAAGMTAEGACAMMGNFMAESSMIPNIAQRGMTKLSDAQYTAAADNGLIDFAHDAVGYGLAQWTYHTRKASLLSWARAAGKSVGDGVTQCQFCIAELKNDFHTIWADLCSSHDLFQLTQVVCNVYENPAVKNVGARYNFAQAFLREMEEHKPEPEPEATKGERVIAHMQLDMAWDGYYPWDRIDGTRNELFRETWPKYAADVAKC